MYNTAVLLSRTARFNVSRLFQHVLSLNGSVRLHSRHFSTLEEENVENYYILKDIRDSTKCTGFDENDPRGKFTGRDDSVEEDDEDLHRMEKVPERLEHSIPLYRKCKLTGMPIKVELPVKKLDSEELVSSILFLFPSLPFDVEIKDLFAYLKGGIVPSDDQLLRIKMLEPRVSELLTHNNVNLRQALVVALVFDHFGILTHELRNKLLLAMQLNIYAFRPYDIAVAVYIYGKVEGRYEPFINTLGLVFYDLMIGGKTSLSPSGPSLSETLAVLSSFTSIGFSTSKLTDPIFGSLYSQLNDMSEAQMIFALKSFFTISGDSKFVEFYSRILSILLKMPLLFVENFQDHAQKALSLDFGIQPVTVEAYPKDVDFPSDVPSLLLLFDALSNCKSEFLISSIHNRIEFKRLWSHNIKTGNMPWRPPGLGPIETDAVDPQDDASMACKNGAGITYKNDQNISITYKNGTTVTYKDQLPDLYLKVSRLIKDTFGPLLSCAGITRYIFEHNRAVMGSHGVEHAYFPHAGSMAKMVGAVDSDRLVFPMFKMDVLLEYNGAFTADKSAKYADDVDTFCNNPGVNGRSTFIPKDVERVNEAIHGLLLGNVGLLEEKRDAVEFMDIKAMDIANCIAFINDYSRYVDGLPVNLLGSLYYRLLFTGSVADLDAITLLEKICPKSLTFDNSHIAYMEDSEFYKTVHGTEYHLPPPPTRSLFMGDKNLYSIILYIFAHYFHHYITPSSMTESQIARTNVLLQQLMYPFYICSMVESRPAWDMVYFFGMFNKKDVFLDLKASGLKCKTITETEESSHINAVFMNAVSLYLEGLVERLDRVSLRCQVKLSRTVLMLKICGPKSVPDSLVYNLLDSVNSNLLSYFADPKKEEMDDRLTVKDDVMLMQVLSDALEVGSPEHLYHLLNRAVLSIFKRMGYYSLEEAIPLLTSLSSIATHLKGMDVDNEVLENGELLENDELLEQISQSVEIVRGQLLESAETHLDEQGRERLLSTLYTGMNVRCTQ